MADCERSLSESEKAQLKADVVSTLRHMAEDIETGRWHIKHAEIYAFPAIPDLARNGTWLQDIRPHMHVDITVSAGNNDDSKKVKSWRGYWSQVKGATSDAI